MNNLIWRLIARLITHPRITNALIRHAQRAPYTHIMSADGTACYMGRWWLFNPYPASGAAKRFGWGWLPSVRIHHIMREDQDRDLHDHPWNARTIVLRGDYTERRLGTGQTVFTRMRGYTGRLLFGQYHQIVAVSDGGVWTCFITWKYRGVWGFLVDGHKVPWREYLGVKD